MFWLMMPYVVLFCCTANYPVTIYAEGWYLLMIYQSINLHLFIIWGNYTSLFQIDNVVIVRLGGNKDSHWMPHLIISHIV